MRSIAVGLIAVLALGAAADRAWAGYAKPVDSLEWAVADADLIVRGTVIRTTPHGAAVDGEQWYRVDIAVRELVKGPRLATVTIAERSSAGGGRKPDRDVLLFLVDSDRAATETSEVRYRIAPYALRAQDLNPRWSGPVHWVDLGTPIEIVTRDFGVVTERAELLARTRNQARRPPVRTSHRLVIPGGTAAHTAMRTPLGGWLRVPVDAALERVARTLVTSRSARDRVHGIAAIEHFRSPENTALVRALLRDRSRFVRERAAEVLAGWSAR